ncbi:NAD(P)H-dependent oxidoreductase subunit E [Geobacter sp. FeAm09]|uniref:NADH-quinone oxidoreductase subunit NuoE family protein n=1 Tax=Geobacter sp. FeAm09 TaxID=2597769 RepID=UPI0011ECB6B4|nr:NAD(P)H-dependent oxidoreductase subunit E [Geobacter sp. FeAm09]QEM67043.1 NAD(P)H-dependent oxidoreductase subunit E [Geobacter sp. FeAm09]
MSDPEDTGVPPCLSEIIRDLPEIEQQLVNILNGLQEKNGHIPEEELRSLALLTRQPESALHALVGFFDSFRTCPLGRNHLSVCYGTACYARGADLVYDRLAGEVELDADGTSTDGFITLDKVQCVGACSLAPVIRVNGKLEGPVKSHRMSARLRELKKDDVLPD